MRVAGAEKADRGEYPEKNKRKEVERRREPTICFAQVHERERIREEREREFKRERECTEREGKERRTIHISTYLQSSSIATSHFTMVTLRFSGLRFSQAFATLSSSFSRRAARTNLSRVESSRVRESSREFERVRERVCVCKWAFE
jgi:hypothetical protein